MRLGWNNVDTNLNQYQALTLYQSFATLKIRRCILFYFQHNVETTLIRRWNVGDDDIAGGHLFFCWFQGKNGTFYPYRSRKCLWGVHIPFSSSKNVKWMQTPHTSPASAFVYFTLVLWRQSTFYFNFFSLLDWLPFTYLLKLAEKRGFLPLSIIKYPGNKGIENTQLYFWFYIINFIFILLLFNTSPMYIYRFAKPGSLTFK